MAYSDGWMDAWMAYSGRWMMTLMDEWMDGWHIVMDGWMDA